MIWLKLPLSTLNNREAPHIIFASWPSSAQALQVFTTTDLRGLSARRQPVRRNFAPRRSSHVKSCSSDSEYYATKRSAKGAKKQLIEEFDDSDAEGTTSSGVKTTSNHRDYKPYGVKRARKNCSESHIESDEEVTSKKSKQVSFKPALKKKASNRKPPKCHGWFDSEDEDEAAFQQKSIKKQALQSVLSRRVADGVLRRTADLAGDLFVDLKIYNTADILSVDPKDRWEHAVLSLKYQTSSNAGELLPLKEFIKEIKPSFKEEGKFFSNKKK